jgi:hypothetical protein
MIRETGTTVQLLTHSRQSCFKTCRKQSWFAYEIGLRREIDGAPLRMGSAYHAGLESIANLEGIDVACERVRSYYESCPDGWDQYEWQIECETVLRLLTGYVWRWENEPLEYLAAEQAFQLPLLNPDTGKPTPLFALAGKIDGIVRLQDTRLAVGENKLLGEDIGPDSILWRRMQIDHQISMYMIAARRLGYPVDCVLYNVTRKPTIKPTAIPLLDELGVKIVLDGAGNRVKTKTGYYRTTGDTAQGYVLQTRPMTVEEWGDKLSDDIYQRPDFYYARKEIARLDQDLKEYEYELWSIQQTIREAQKTNRWFKTAGKCCDWCSYFSVCTSNWQDGDSLPEGFIRVANKHPELG